MTNPILTKSLLGVCILTILSGFNVRELSDEYSRSLLQPSEAFMSDSDVFYLRPGRRLRSHFIIDSEQ